MKVLPRILVLIPLALGDLLVVPRGSGRPVRAQTKGSDR